MTALQDQINTALRDYNTDGVPASGAYTPLISDLRTILYGMAVGSQWITEVQNFLGAANAGAARTAIGLGTGDGPTFASLTVSGAVAVDTNTFVVDATNNRVGIGTATPTTGLQVALAASFGSTLAVTGAVTLTAGLVVDTTTLVVDASNNRVGVGTASPGVTLDVVGEGRFTSAGTAAALRVVQTGAANVVLFEDSASTDSTPWLIDQNGVVVHGHTAAITAEPSNTPAHQVHSLSAAAGFWAQRWSADTGPAYIRLGKSRGTTAGTRGTVSSGDGLGSVLYLGDDGAAFRAAAEIRAEADATWGSSDAPGRLVFLTTPDGSATPTEAMRISSTNFLSFNGDLDTGLWSPGTNELAFWSGGAEVFRIEENGVMVLGYTNALASYTGTPKLQVVGTTNSTAQVAVIRSSDDTNYPILTLAKTRGNNASPTIATSGDGLGGLIFTAYDGANYIRGAQIIAEADDTVSSATVPGRLRFYTATTGGTITERLRIDSAGVVRPGADNSQTLGSASSRWSVVYAGTGSINTSDASEKQIIGALNDNEIGAARDVARAIRSFRWNEAIAEKGENGARIHIGPTAQAVFGALAKHGLDPTNYALWCMDTVTDGDGGQAKVRQGVRPDQLALFAIAGLEHRVTVLEEKVAA